MRILLQILSLFILLLVLSGCQEPVAKSDGTLQLPQNKVWAHRVNDIATAQAKENAFGGMELDLVYSPYQNKLLVCHELEDTLHGLTLDQWFAALRHPSRHGYWLDVKGFNYNNADTISAMIRKTLEHYHIVDQAFVESWDPWALQKASQHQLHTSLWVDNFYWSDIDTTAWVEKVNRLMEIAHPDALSCEYRMFDALTTFFSRQNLFLWHTPAELTPENAALTKKLCQHPSVKIVLVDYDHSDF